MSLRTHSTIERNPGILAAIGHYRIVGVAGNGTLGRLYIAEQHGVRGVSNTVALRCVRPELAESAQFRALFFDAASMAPSIEHPNVVTIHELDEVDGTYFVSMEYVPGESVASILTKCNASAPMPCEIAASVVKQVANAVQYLHGRRGAATLPVGLGQGEVDVANVFVTYFGTVKLLSTGLEPIRLASRAAVSGEHSVDSSSHMGASVAPEHGEGAPDRRSDVFNLGVLLWACLTGRRPRLRPGSSAEIDAAAPSRRVVAPSSVRADVPEALDAIAMRALSPDPLARFQSAGEMSEALDRYLLGRDARPTPKHIRRWLEQSFDAERASLQMQIARGRDVPGALSRLGTPQAASSASNVASLSASVRPRELWSTSHSVFSQLARGSIAPSRPIESSPLSAIHDRLTVNSVVRRAPSSPPSLTISEPTRSAAPPAREPRGWIVGAAVVMCAVAALGAAALLSSSDDSSPLGDASRDSRPPDRSGRVDVRSTPEGAAVFVDGEPTGLRTPAVLKGLAAGRKLMLRVEKAGFAREEGEVTIVEGSVENRAFELIASVGLVRFVGAPADARIYVDEVLIDVKDGKRVDLSVGRHTVRVENPSSLIFSDTVDIVAGEQTIRVDGAATTP